MLVIHEMCNQYVGVFASISKMIGWIYSDILMLIDHVFNIYFKLFFLDHIDNFAFTQSL